MQLSLSRRRRTISLVAVSAAALAAVLVPLAQSTTAQAATTGLAQAAQAKGKYFGSATDNPELSDAPYVAILTGGEFDQTTPGNAMKWDTIEPTQGTFNYTKGDAVVSLAKANNMTVRGHTLVWHSQLASWVTSLPLTSVRAAMENHITNEATHYQGQVFAWDVVNEPFNEDGTYRTSVFYNAMGSDYIATALKAARAADPTAKLYINDYNIEGSSAKADAMYALASALKSQGVPLDGIGMQGHLATQYGFPTGMQANIQRFADLGLDVAITELDVRMPLPEDATSTATQITYYTNVVNACMAVTRCVGITLWDYTDKYSWVPSVFSGQGNPLPWDANLAKKPALYNAILTALGGTVPSTSPASSSAAPSGTVACHVTYSVSSQWSNGFVAAVTVGNTGTSAMSGWTLQWTFPSGQTISSSWGGTFAQSGSAVTVTNASWNAAIAAGSSVSIGFVGAYTGTNTAPTAFTVNGATCA